MAKSSSRSNSRRASPGSAKRTPKAKSKPPSVAALGKSIDDLDRQLLKLIDQRGKLVHQLGEVDHRGVVGRVAEASRRIAKLISKTSKSSTALSAEMKADVLRHISSACLQSLHQLRVAYLGPKHSYSHLAAIKYFGDATAMAPVASIAAVFDAVSRNDVSMGIVPIENSTDGRVVDTLGMFVRRRMPVCGEVLLPIHHHLLSRTPREEITEVYSKPQALSQCRGWLASQLPHAKWVEISSTAAAAQLAAEKRGAAAVASLEAGRQYELDVIDTNIEDNPNNVTRFAVLGRDQPPRSGDDKTALLFQVNHQPGALADAMTVFKRHSLNLTWIESFPLPGKQSEYLFFVETTAHRDDSELTAAIGALGKKTQRLEILGSYPRAEL